jgi:hypothetical protein
VADARIMIVGHGHHFFIADCGSGRTIMQAPASDGGSDWFTARSGAHTPAGFLSFVISESYGPRCWGDLAVITGET